MKIPPKRLIFPHNSKKNTLTKNSNIKKSQVHEALFVNKTSNWSVNTYESNQALKSYEQWFTWCRGK